MRIKFRVPTPLLFVILILFACYEFYEAKSKRYEFPAADVPILLYSNQAGDNLQETFREAILSAKVSIVCIIYSLTDDTIIHALRHQAEQGLSVSVVCDPVATQDVAFKLGNKVRLSCRRQKGLMHNKLLAIDHKQAWIGSANFTRDSLLIHANLVVGIQSEDVAKSIEEKAEFLSQKKTRKFTPLVLDTTEQSFQISYLPDDQEALQRLISLLHTAKKSLKVAMFTFTHPELIQAVINAHKRGLDVQVVLDHDSSRKTSSKAYARFRREGVPTYVSQRTGLLHEKIAIIDDKTLVCGSANWTKAAFTANDENLCILTDLNRPQQEKLVRFWQTTLLESK